MDNSARLTDLFYQGPYRIIAPGTRDVKFEEVIEIFKVLCEKSEFKDLISLHSNRPETIAIDKSQRQYSCGSFNDKCDCFLPRVEFENSWCRRARREEIEKTDRRNIKENDDWRAAVFARDDFTCQECGVKGGTLNAHHVKPFKSYPKLRYIISNGVTLCASPCHKSKHKVKPK